MPADSAFPIAPRALRAKTGARGFGMIMTMFTTATGMRGASG